MPFVIACDWSCAFRPSLWFRPSLLFRPSLWFRPSLYGFAILNLLHTESLSYIGILHTELIGLIANFALSPFVYVYGFVAKSEDTENFISFLLIYLNFSQYLKQEQRKG